MLKHLQKLLLIAALCLPWVTQAQCPDNEVGCPITIVATDDYGDGWNGAAINVYQGTTLRGSFTISDGASYTSTVNICTGDSVRLVWVVGSYDEECQFTVLNGDGTPVISNEWGDSYSNNETIVTFEPACPSCPQPGNLAVDLTSNGIEVTWVANGDESSWLVYVNGDYEATTTDEEYTISDPVAGSVYSITVAALCGVGDTSTFIGPVVITIPGAAITDYPYSTGFETGDDTNWSFANDATNAWAIGSAAHSTGANALYISNNNGTANSYTNSSTQFSYAYRAFTVDDAVDMAISFDWQCYGESSYDYLRAWIAPVSFQFSAGHSPDGGTSAYNYTDATPSGWIDLGGKMNLQSSWQTQVTTFHVNAGTYYLVFMWANDNSGGTQPPAGVDNIILTELSCAQPQNLSVDALQTSADLIWSPGGDETSWELAFDNNNYYVNDTIYNATNLTANTPYTFAVRAICGDGDTSFWSTYSFRTPCDFIDSLPYVNSFEDASTGSSTTFVFGDPCWTLTTDATQYPYVYVSSSSSYAHSGSKGIYWYRSNSTGTYGSYQCLVLPGIDIDNIPLNTLQLKFWAKASSDSYNPVFQVGVMTDPTNINTFVPVNTVNVQGTTWTEYETFFAGYEGTGRYMAVRANNTGDYWYAYVDEFTVDLLPSCPHVASVSVDSASSDYIGISWVPAGEESEWLVYLNDSIIGSATDTTYEITNLSLNTLYSISVAALCDATDTSALLSITGRTTAGEPVSTFPFACDFEIDADNNSCASNWIVENGANGWFVGTATNNGGSRSLYVSDSPTGTNNSYSGSACVSYAYVTMQMDAGEYAYTYDWKCNGESSFDYLRVALAPSTQNLPTSYSSWGTGATAPSGFTALDGGKLNLQTSWVTNSGEFSITTPGLYNFIFVWRNDGSVFNTPAAAIDNFMIARNTCPKPVNVHTELVTSDSILVAWQPGGTETSWIVSDGTNSVEVQSPDTSYLFDQLSPSTNYHITVQAVCSDEDSSLFAAVNVRTACGAVNALPIFEDFETTGTTSSSNNNFIPCWTKVCNATSTYYPYVSNSTTYNHTPGGQNGLYWYRSSSTGSYGDYNIIVLPQIDTNALPLNTTMLTFWAKPSSTSYAPILKVGAMQHPDSVSTFQTVRNVNIEHTSTDWVKYTIPFNEFVDSVGCSYVAIRSDYDGSYWYVYVDDITLDSIPDCAPVEDLVVEAGVTSALLHWTTLGTQTSGAEIQYKESGSTNWSTITVTDNYAVLTGLTPDTTYDVRVATVCGDANATDVAAQFQTGSFPCSQFDQNSLINVTVGQGTTTSTYIPSYSLYNYGYTQQFYTAYEIGGAGVITSITLTPANVAQQRTYEIYMGTYSDSTASSYVNPTGLTCVYNGGHIPLTANQPVTFNLTTPFNYNGTSNLVVIFRDLTGSYVSGNSWKGDNAWSGVSMYSYQDGSAYNVPMSGSGTDGGSFRNQITFFGGSCLQVSTCAAPVPYVTSIGTTTVDVVWAPGNTETSWRLYYRNAGTTNYTLAGTANTNSYQFTGLNSGSNYEFMVVPVCADSMSATVSAVTNCAEITSLPYFENFNSWGAGSGVMPNCWYRTGSYSTYTYISASQNHSGNGGGSIYMYQSGSNHSTIFFPAIDTTLFQANQLQLVFYAKNTSASYLHPGFEVGVMTDPTDISTFVPVETVYHTAGPNVWEIFEVSLANYTGNGAYIGIRTADNPNSGTQYTYTYPYLDDFTLEMIPTCPRPDSLTATNATTTSVDLGWHERGNATTWIIEYGPLGFTLGTGTQITANSNPFTLSNLPVAYQGEFYVKSVCGAGDTGEYSRMPFAFATSQIPATLPYSYDFETSAEWANWQTSSNSTNNWYLGTAVAHNSTSSMYVSADQGATYKPYSYNAVVNAAAYRDIDFGPNQSSFTISFDARVGGTLSASYDGLMVFLVDPSIATIPSNSNITSPWGNVNDLYRIATVRLDTVWHTHTASFDTISGVKRVAFFWFNQSTSSYENLPEPAAIDNIQIFESPCPRPVATTVNAVGANTANLSWFGPSSATYEVIYRQYPGSAANNVYVQTNTNSIMLTGLEPVTEYAVWVRKICGTDTSLTSDGITFITEMCDNATWFHNYDTTMTSSTSTYSPIGYSFYNYGYVQTIFDSAYLAGMDGDITAMAFEPTVTTAGDEYENMTVYLANVSESDLSSGWILPDDSAHIFYKVIDNASFSYTATGIQMHGFDTIFTWDGHSNILVSVVRNNGSYTSGATFAAHNHSGNKGRYVYQDGSPYDYTNPSAAGYAISTIGDIYFITCGASCRIPTALPATDVTYNSATLNWSGNVTEYEVSYKAVTDATWPAEVAVSNATSYAVSGLVPATQYQFRVRAICDAAEALISDWVEGTFVTDSLPCFVPENLTVVETGYTTATLQWDAADNQTQWSIHVWNSANDYNYDANEHPFIVAGLAQNLTYYAAVKAICGNGATESEYSDTITFTTGQCAQVTGVNVTGITSHSAVVSWTPTGAPRYKVEYGDRGFPQGTGITVYAENGQTTVTLDNLVRDNNYSVFVMAICEEGVEGAWSERYDFATLDEEAIDVVNGNMNLSIYPNPTSDATTIALSGVNGEVQIVIVDMNGRTVMSDSMSCEGDCTKRMEVSGLAQGAYFVRVSGEGVNQVKKLVVK